MSTVDKIKELCISKDITPTELERILGFGKGVLRKWDEVSPSSDKLQKVADYFNVTTDFLLDREANQEFDEDVRAIARNMTKLSTNDKDILRSLVKSMIEIGREERNK